MINRKGDRERGYEEETDRDGEREKNQTSQKKITHKYIKCSSGETSTVESMC